MGSFDDVMKRARKDYGGALPKAKPVVAAKPVRAGFAGGGSARAVAAKPLTQSGKQLNERIRTEDALGAEVGLNRRRGKK